MTLVDLRRNDKFRILKVTLCGEIGRRLVDMGLNQGVEGQMLRCALFADPIEITIRGYNLSLRKTEAIGVEVELVEAGIRGEECHRGWRNRLFGRKHKHNHDHGGSHE